MKRNVSAYVSVVGESGARCLAVSLIRSRWVGVGESR